MEPSDEILDLAGAILDGRAIEWGTIDSKVPAADRPAARQLRILADLAHLHRSLPLDLATADQDECPFLPGGDWGHLRLRERIGHGRYGDVFRAWDTRLDAEVALKFVSARASSESGSTVIDEGRLLARVRHPNVVSVYGAERIGDWIGIWTEFVRGRTLEQVLNEHGVFSAHEAAGIGIQVCRALAAVHAAGLLHRDIKAANVMREDGGRIVLMDLGAAADHLVRNAARDIAGTPLYLAPEVLNGAPASSLSDIYSVGVLLYRLVTNSYPVTGRSFDEIRQAHSEGRRKLLRDIRPELPDDFVTLVERAIDPIPERRITSAGEFDRALRLADAHTAPRRRTRAKRAIAAAAVAVLAVAAVVFSLVFAGRLRTDRTRPSGSEAGQAPTGSTPAIRAVTAPTMGLFRAGAPSFDGRFYSNTDLNQDLMVVDLANGTARPLTHKGDSDEMAEFSIMSPDGESVAYAWLTLDDVYELRIIGSNGQRPRVVVGRGHAEYIVPIEWSRDASQILCLLYQRGGVVQLALVKVADGDTRVLRDFRGPLPQHASLSPDNRFVVFDLPADGKTAGQHDIFIAATTGDDARTLIADPTDDTSPAWTPDGQLFFLSDRTGTVDGWIVPINEGVVQVEPTLVARNIGRVTLSGFTRVGALYYWRQTGLVDVFTVPIDGSPASAPASSRIASRFVGTNIGPSWSPDGRYLAYLSQRLGLPRGPGATVIVIRDVKSGTDRELIPDLKLEVMAPRWSRDGRTLLVRGSNRESDAGVFLVDVVSGDVSPGVVAPRVSDVGRYAWWVDGRSIVYNSPRGIAVRDVASGGDTLPFEATRALTGFRVAQFEPSPDGRSVAFSGVVERTNPPARVVAVMPIGGSPRELIRVAYPEQVFLQAWMPNSQELLFTRRNVDVTGPHQLWRATVNDGRVVDTGIGIPGFTQINQAVVHPDGKTVAYTGGEATWTLWVMERFLPEPIR